MAVPRIYDRPDGRLTPRKKTPQEQLSTVSTKPKTPTTTVGASPMPGPTSVQPSMGIQPRPMSSDLTELVNAYKTQIMAGAPSAQDIMGSAEYQDMAAGIDRQAQKAYSGLVSDMGRRGVVGMRSKQGQIHAAEQQGAFDAAKAGMLTQMIQAERDRRQQAIGNTGSLINTLSNLQGQAFNQGLAEFQTTAPYNMLTAGQKQQGDQFDKRFAIDEAGVTGRYVNPALQGAAQQIIAATQAFYDQNDGISEDQARAMADKARAQLAQLGGDPSAFGSDKTYAEKIAALQALGQPTMQNRQVTAGYTGIDPYTGQPTLQGQAATQNLSMGQLQYDVASNPQYGLAAQAQSDIANTQSLIADRASGGASGLTPYQQWQIERDLLEQERKLSQDQQKANQQRVEQYTKTYNVTPAGAESWLALEEALTQARAQGMDRQTAYNEFLGPLLNSMPLTATDRAFVYTLFSASFGDSEAINRLETFRKVDEPPK